MPSYQDYVVARDDIDPNTPAGGAARAAAAATEKGGSEKQSRVVRTRTFLIGNLDRPRGEPSASTDGTPVRHFVFPLFFPAAAVAVVVFSFVLSRVPRWGCM